MVCRYLTPKEIDSILETGFKGKYAQRNKIIFLLGIFTGFRISELLQIKLGHICQIKYTSNSRKITIFNKITVSKDNMKSKTASRTVPLNDFVRNELLNYIETEWPYDYLPDAKLYSFNVLIKKSDIEHIKIKNIKTEFNINSSNLSKEKKDILLKEKILVIPKVVKREFGMPLFPSQKENSNPTYFEDGTLNKYDKWNLITNISAVNILKDVFRLANLPDVDVNGVLACHTLRKTYAYEAQKIHGDDIFSIQKSLGHKLITSTQHYIQYQDPKIENGILNMYPNLTKETEIQQEMEELLVNWI